MSYSSSTERLRNSFISLTKVPTLKGTENANQRLANFTQKSQQTQRKKIMVMQEPKYESHSSRTTSNQDNINTQRDQLQKSNQKEQIQRLWTEMQNLTRQIKLRDGRISQLTRDLADKQQQTARSKNTSVLTGRLHAKQIAEYEQRISQYEKKLAEIQQGRDVASVSVTSSNEELKRFMKEKQVLMLQLQKQKELQQQIKFQFSQALQGLRESADKELGQKSWIIEDLKRHVSEVQRTLHARTQQMQVLMEEVNGGRQQVQEMNARMEEMSRYIESSSLDYTTNYNQLKHQYENLWQIYERQKYQGEQFAKSQQQKITQLQADFHHQLTIKQKQIQQLKQQCQNHLSYNQQYQTQTTAQFQNQKHHLELEILKLHSLVQQVQTEVDSQQKQIKQKQNAFSNLETQIHLLQTQLHSKSEQLQTANQNLQLLPQIEFQLAEIQNDNQHKLLLLNQKDHEIHKLLQLNHSLEQQILANKSEIQVLEQVLIDSKKHFTQLKNQITTLLNQQNQQKQSQLSTFNQIQIQLQNKHQAFLNQLNQTSKQLSKIKEELILTKSQLQNCRLQLNQTNQFLIQKQTQINQNVNLLQEKKNQLDEKNVLIQEKETELNEKNVLIQEKETKIEKKLAQIQQKEVMLQLKDSRIFELQEKLKNKKESQQRQKRQSEIKLQKLNLALLSQIQHLQSQLSEYQSEVFQLRKQHSILREQTMSQQVQFQSLRLQLQRSRKENSLLTNENQILGNQLEALEGTTNYLKKQLKSTLDSYQSALADIRQMKESTRSCAKLTPRTPYTSRSQRSSRVKSYQMLQKTPKLQPKFIVDMNSSAVSLETELNRQNQRLPHRREKTQDLVIQQEEGSQLGYKKEKDRRRKYLKKISGISSITMCQEEKYTVTEKDSSFRRQNSNQFINHHELCINHNEFSINHNFSSDPSLFYSEVQKFSQEPKVTRQRKETQE